MGLGGDRQPLAVAGRAAPALGYEFLFCHGVVDDAQLQDAVLLESDRDAKTAVAVQVVGGAVQRIDDPARRTRTARSGLLTQKGVIRKLVPDDAFDQRFARGVRLAGEIGTLVLRSEERRVG